MARSIAHAAAAWERWPPAAQRPGETGARAISAGASAAASGPVLHARTGPLASTAVGQVSRAAGTLSLGGGPARLPGVPSSETFCAALWSLALARERREGWVTVGSSPLAVPAGYVALRAGSADLRLPPWEEVLAALDGIVPRDAALMPVPRHYDGSLQEQWLQLSSGGALPAALAALETWAAHAAAVRVAAGSPTREQSGGGDAEMRVAGRRARPPGAAARVAVELPCATGSPAGATAVRLFPRARRVGAAAGRGSGRGAAPVRGADVEASSRAAPPAADPAFGACSGVVPIGVAEIKALMAALPCNLPGHVDGWMRKQAFHLSRILAAEPRPETGFTTDEARWRYEMAVLGPKMEFVLLRRAATEAGRKWAQGLGEALPSVRAALPPLDDVAWRVWDGSALLSRLRAAVDAPDAQPRARPPAAAGERVCDLLERGRVPAGRAALYGEVPVPPAPPSESMRAELQGKNPRPASPGDVVSEDEWQAAAAACEDRCRRLADDRRISADDLLAAARMQRAGAAAGPDGWSGAYVRRLATLFPTEVAELLWREFRSLSDTYDPLLACSITDATVGGIAKPRGGFRPIAIGRCAVRCMVAHVVKRARPDLRRLLERGDQFALTGVLPAVVQPFKMMAKCARAGVPWAFTDDDFSNAFNAVSQRALFGAAQRIATVAPELAAVILRAQCMIRGGRVRGDGAAGAVPAGCPEPYVVERFARGGGQGCPDMPAAFAAVVAELNAHAEAAMGDVSCDMSAAAAVAVLWPLVRDQAQLPPTESAPMEWAAAVDQLMAQPRPSMRWGGARGEASSAYADDTHSGGWAVACLVKSLRRVAAARTCAALHADPLKCKVLTSTALKPLLDVLLEPLRGGEEARWEVVTSMRVLGVTLSDPTDRPAFEAAVAATLRVRVVAPADLLIAEVAGGARPATAYFALTRFVLPNALYHMQVWGLLCGADVWAEVDGALDRFCEAVCPLDLRGRLRGEPHGLRAELALPQRFGGLGIPRVATEAPHRAAEQWDHGDAVAAGMLPEHAAAAYCRDSSPLGGGRRVAVGMDGHFMAVAEALAAAVPRADRARVPAAACSEPAAVRHVGVHRRAMGPGARPRRRGVGRAVAADVRRGAGGDAAAAGPSGGWLHVPRPAHGVRRDGGGGGVRPRGGRARSPRSRRRSGSPSTTSLAARGTGRRRTGGSGRTPRSRSSRGRPSRSTSAPPTPRRPPWSPAGPRRRTCARSRTGRLAKYADYYRSFAPFVIDLSGAVSEQSYGVLKQITKEAAKAARPRLHWESFDWAVRIQRRIAIAMVKTTAYLATRVPARMDASGSRAGLCRPLGMAVGVVSVAATA